MRQSILAILLIGLMILGGCTAPTKPSVAAPAEWVEETEQEQAQSVILPSEPPKEETAMPQPEPQPEPQLPAEEEKKNPELTFVKFWENVPEMSLEEAKRIRKERNDQKRHYEPLTDEERMALYVISHQQYLRDLYNSKEAVGDHLYIWYLSINSSFMNQIQDLELFRQALAWNEQSFAEGYRPSPSTTEFFYYVEEDEKDYEIEFFFRPYEGEQPCNYGDPDVYELFKNTLRFYLSMEPVHGMTAGFIRHYEN